MLFGKVWKRPGLSRRDRSLVTVAALANGWTREELAELVTHLAFYAGWQAASTAVPALRKAFEEAGASACGPMSSATC